MIKNILEYIFPLVLHMDIMLLVKNLQEDLATSAKYMLSSFPYHVEYESRCELHCINFACSDPKERTFQQQCTENHVEDCHHCRLLPSIVRDMHALISKVSESLQTEEIEEFQHDIFKANEDIDLYMKSIMRAKVGSDYWDTLFGRCDPTEAYVTMDFGTALNI